MKKKFLLSILIVFNFSVHSQDNDGKLEKPEPANINDRVVKNRATKNSDALFTLTNESEPHDVTWLQWPHMYQYGAMFSKRLDLIWIDITSALVSSEKVNIIVYDEVEKSKVINFLNDASVPLSNINFKIFQTDDCFIRDNGPVFVRDKNGVLNIEDWGFNGWGRKAKYTLCDAIPSKIGADLGIMTSDYNSTLIIEEDAIQMDNSGTVLATKSSILNNNRNQGKGLQEIEKILKKNLGASKFIWLNGTSNADNADFHIDSFARFLNDTTIVSMDHDDLLELKVSEDDIEKLSKATNNIGIQYNFIKLPLTNKDVTTAFGKKLGRKASYIGYYVANNVVLVPNYSDENDAVANGIIQSMFPDKKVVGIDIRNLYALGGTIRNVTKEQPKKILSK